MRRRAALAGISAGLAFVAAPAAAQLGEALGRPGASGKRPGVDEALRRTVTLVLRAEARRSELPPSMTDPEPLPPELTDLLVPGAVLPDDFPAEPAPESIDRRLPHASGGTIWIIAGRDMAEIDPIRLRVLSVAPDVLPPDI